MKARSNFSPLLLLLATLPVVGGCLFGTPTKPPIEQPPEPYLPYYDADSQTAMDNLVANFQLAWEKMDLAEYRDSILYDGTVPATDGQLYAPFVFYYDRSTSDPNIPDDDDVYDREIQRAENMFGGLPGQDAEGKIYPGIKEIAFQLTANEQWANPLDPSQVEGDEYPTGTKQRPFETHLFITLKSAIQGSNNITAWDVQDRLILYIIPVQIENEDVPGTYHTV